jgi:hypothetical protein
MIARRRPGANGSHCPFAPVAPTQIRPLPVLSPPGTLDLMGINRIRQRVERRRAIGVEPPTEPRTRGEAALYGRTLGLAEAAQELEQVAAAGDAAGAVPAALGCATSAFESIANSMLMMRGLVLRSEGVDGAESPEAERLARLLFAIDQNLRFAAHAADLGRRDASGSGAESSPALRSLAS